MKAIWELLGQKRFWLPIIGTAVMTVVMAVGSQLGIDEEILVKVIAWVGTLFGAGTLSNAAADFGKEKAKIDKGQ